jgi:hypothetical protein
MADPARVLEEALEPSDRARLAHELIQSLEGADVDFAMAYEHP